MMFFVEAKITVRNYGGQNEKPFWFRTIVIAVNLEEAERKFEAYWVLKDVEYSHWHYISDLTVNEVIQ